MNQRRRRKSLDSRETKDLLKGTAILIGLALLIAALIISGIIS